MLKLNAYQLKWIAIIGMFVSHLTYAMPETIPLWLMIPMYATGGLTFPIMGYFVVEGYRHTSNLKKYILRLFIFGLIAMPFHWFVFDGLNNMLLLNIMFTIIFSLLILIMYDKIKSRILFWILFVLLSPITLVMDLWIVGVLLVLLYHIIPNETARRIVPAIMMGVIFFVMSAYAVWSVQTLLEVGTPQADAAIDSIVGLFGGINVMYSSLAVFIGFFFAAFLIKQYNGERGKSMKWFFYAFYPIHFVILTVLAIFFRH
ncbi:MAG: conjugal transfer protein TraX [Defluviitaleaceae bacterium]|nr:conjugal transfer protein TraX [Defluviitaleaceae bacterium]